MFKKLLLFVIASLFAAAALAQTYPYSTPTYVPNSIFPATAVVSGVNQDFITNGTGVVGLQVAGTCTNLSASLQGSVNGTSFVPVTAHVIGSTATASSVTAAGAWRINAAGLSKIRFAAGATSASGVVGACSTAMVGTAAAGGTLE